MATLVGNRLFVADSELSKVYVFNSRGLFDFSSGEGLLTRLVGIAYNGVARKIYVSDTAGHTSYI